MILSANRKEFSWSASTLLSVKQLQIMNRTRFLNVIYIDLPLDISMKFFTTSDFLSN